MSTEDADGETERMYINVSDRMSDGKMGLAFTSRTLGTEAHDMMPEKS